MKQNNLQSKVDIKIFILFLLDQINYPLDDESISNIVFENGYVGSFDFAECFSELVELHHIEADEVEGKTYYMISDTGRRVSAELHDQLVDSIREISSRSAARILSLQRRGAHLEVDISERADRKFHVVCRVEETEGTLFSFGLTVPTRVQAERISANFRERPERMFRGLMTVVTGDVDYLLE